MLALAVVGFGAFDFDVFERVEPALVPPLFFGSAFAGGDFGGSVFVGVGFCGSDFTGGGFCGSGILSSVSVESKEVADEESDESVFC